MQFLGAWQLVMWCPIGLFLGQCLWLGCKEYKLKACQPIISHPRLQWEVEWILEVSLCSGVLLPRPISNRSLFFWTFVVTKCWFLFLINTTLSGYRWEEKTLEWGCLATLRNKNQDVSEVMQLLFFLHCISSWNHLNLYSLHIFMLIVDDNMLKRRHMSRVPFWFE